MIGNEISLRSRLVGGSAFAVLVLLAVSAGFIAAFSRQEATVREIETHQIMRSQKLGTLLARLSADQRVLAQVLIAAAANGTDEEGIFEQGRAVIDGLRATAKDFAAMRPSFKGDSELLAIFDATQKEIDAYRSTVLSVVEISTADASMAQTEMLKASASYVKLVVHMSTIVSSTNDAVIERLNGALASSKRQNSYLLIGAILAVLAVVAVSGLLYRDIARKIAQLIQSMNRVSSGDLKAAVPLLTRTDEIGDIAKSIELFRSREKERGELVSREDAMRVAERERATAVTRMVAEFRSVVWSIVEKADEAVSRMHRTSQDLTAIAAEADERAQEVAHSSQEVSVNVDVVAGAAEELSASFGGITQETERAHQFVDGVNATAERTNQIVRQLSENATRVGDISGLIRDVSEQINLLALNATIEAARAGEFGRGFAVVASEIKALAGQTAAATNEIGGQVQSIRQLMMVAAESIKSISGAMTDVNAFTRQIATAVGDQSRATGEIAQNSHAAAERVLGLVENMNVVTKAIERTNLSAGAVREASDAMSDQTKTLQRAVNEFLLRVAAA
jgi:methyl-accepting chemotaxis protein